MADRSNAERWFQASFRSAGIAKAIAGLDGRVLEANDAYCALTGYSEEELRRRTIADVTHPDDRESDLVLRGRLLAGEMAGYQREKRFLHRDGRVLQVLVVVSLLRDAAGAPCGFLGELQDVTAVRAAERALDEQRAHLATLVESLRRNEALLEEAEHLARLGHWVYDVREDRVMWSRELTRLFGLETGEHGLRLAEAFGRVHPDDVAATSAAFLAALEGAPLDVSYRVPAEDGAVVHMHTRGTPQRDEAGRVVRLVGTAQDVSDRLAAEAALRSSEQQLRQAQKMEAIGRLAGGVAHDFNNLLTVIAGNAELLLAADLGARERRRVDEILAASDRAARLTEGLLAFSRRQVMAPEVLDLNAVVRDLEDIVRRLIGEDVEVVTELAPDLAPVRVDPGQMGQVILNLAVNARDAMPGGGTLTIGTANVVGEDLPGGGLVRLVIADTGHGMDEDIRSRAFEPFFTTKPPGKGTGLGLSTVFGIVAQSGGAIAIDSAPGAGAAFRIDLPRAEGPRPASAAARGGEAPPRGTATVLLVEDERGVRELARAALESAGYRVLEAADGAGALAFCAGPQRPDLLLTDVVMPRMSGPELAREVVRRVPGVRVLFMTGYLDDEALADVRRDGDALLHKPFSPLGLLRRVHDVLAA